MHSTTPDRQESAPDKGCYNVTFFWYAIGVNSAAVSLKPPVMNKRRRVLLACLLFAAQFVSQLHVLQHLESADHDDPDGEVCALCIIAAATDQAVMHAAVPASNSAHHPHPVLIGGERPAVASLSAYQERAPPPNSSIA